MRSSLGREVLGTEDSIEGMSRDFIYLSELGGRNVMVDSRAILEALDDIYDADRIVADEGGDIDG